MQKVEIVEVGPRDGLQNERVNLSTADKVKFIRGLLASGIKRIEAVSFVRPDLVPQMADAEQVAAALPRQPDVSYIGLVLNRRGALRALAAGLDELGAVCSVSDTFARRNQGQSAEGTLSECKEIMRMAQQASRRAHITISVAFGCPFEGEVDPTRVIEMARAAAAAGATEVSLADSIGVAAPGGVAKLVAQTMKAIAPTPVRVHFHNTRNTGLANVWAAVSAGAATVDASLGGIGGCPFAPRATGNVPTEDVVYMLDRSDCTTGIDLAKLIECNEWLGRTLGRELPGMLTRAGVFPKPPVTSSRGAVQ